MLFRTLLAKYNFQIRQALRQSLLEAMEEVSCIAAVCQMTSTNDKIVNYRVVADLVRKAKEQNAKMVFFPEGCDYIANNSEESIRLAEEVSGPLIQNYCDLAKTYKIWISIGGFHERAAEHGNKIYNTHFVIDKTGEIRSKYRKLHLFDVDIPDKNLHLNESKDVVPGSCIVEPIITPIGKVGLAICYDLRFPEMSTILRKHGASVLSYPSAFTHATGKLHWEALLRARAIETQCYVVAPAQVGAHNAKRSSYGCAMIVDPSGRILGRCSQNDGKPHEPEIIFADLIDTRVCVVREEMPVFDHRRNDVYTLTGSVNTSLEPSPETENFMFSDNIIPRTTVFFESPHSFAFTNIRCVVPGHVLVATKRVALRLVDLQDVEIADLFQTVVKVQKVIEEAYKCTSSTIVIQDGKEAGQTVKHVHVHVLPRKEGDFKRNDDIYDILARHDNPETVSARREDTEMSTEASMLKAMFPDNK